MNLIDMFPDETATSKLPNNKFNIKMQNIIIIHASSEENDTIKVDVTKLQYFTPYLI